jgi:1-acyl-sn-glycerol-3-phosphate acyltransferase
VRQWLGSLAFTIFLVVAVAVYASLLFATLPLPGNDPYRWAVGWARAIMRALRRFCGLDWSVSGREHLPSAAAIVLMKHSSAWETIAQILIFPRQSWVLKQELLRIPLFGWALRKLKPIAIDRKGGATAVQQVLSQGQSRLAEGNCVIIFPEGTRMPVGEARRDRARRDRPADSDRGARAARDQRRGSALDRGAGRAAGAAELLSEQVRRRDSRRRARCAR